MHFNKIILALAAAGFASGAYATNGMNMDAYGPIAGGMGGASMAYDNGTAAMMNNPATLGLAAAGSRLDLAVGFLGPDVSMNVGGGPTASSGGDAYFMPAVGYTRKNGALTYGIGVFAQGGMGTEWDDSVFVSNYSPDGLAQRSELGVGRAIIPLSYEVNPNFQLGGSVDYVWAMLDMKMALPGYFFAPAASGGLVTANSAGFTGALAGLTSNWVAGGPSTYGRLDFSDDSDFTGKAKATGWAGKLGFVYKVSPNISVGGSYHSKTALGDLKTSASGAVFTADVTGDAAADMSMPGKLTVHDFEWPETYALGVSIQATPKLMIAADVKQIGWEDVMDSFKMTYTMGTEYVSFALPQMWDDQTVFQIGGSYKVTDALTVRAGASFADNPIPDATMNFLFPAIVENHYTLGFGYAFNPTSEVNFSLAYAPEVTQVNPNPVPTVGNVPVTVDHSQLNWQLMYTKRF